MLKRRAKAPQTSKSYEVPDIYFGDGLEQDDPPSSFCRKKLQELWDVTGSAHVRSLSLVMPVGYKHSAPNKGMLYFPGYGLCTGPSRC